MPKQIQFSDDARAAIKRGVDLMANTVGVTLGPLGRNVVLDDDFGPPKVCSDGVTIVKEIDLEDPFENMGAQLLKEAATKTNDAAGDGTTTATILAQAIIHEGFKNLAAGADPMALRRGIEKGAAAVKDNLSKMSLPVEGQAQIAQVASLSAHDDEMGGIIAGIIEKVGQDGVITIEESKGLRYEEEFVDGMEIDRGYVSPYLVTDKERMKAEIESPHILITDKKISAMADLLPTLEKLLQVSKNLVLIAEDVEGEALATLVVNKLRGTMNVLAIKAPGFGDRRKALLEDLAILTGANVISEETGRKLESADISDLGQARRVVATKDDTTFVGGAGAEDAIQGRITQLKAQIENTSSDYDREKLEERAAKLTGGVAILKVGAATEIELKEKKSRLEDALAATRAASEQGIVPGGGLALIRARSALESLDLEGDELTGANILGAALATPLKLISENSGHSGEVILAASEDGEDDWGYDAEAGEFTSLLERGIIDPTKVTRAVIENAASVAGMVMTTESLITDSETETPFVPPPGAPPMDF